MTQKFPLARGSVLGIPGGGQLAQMLADAARRAGYRTHVWLQDANEPAGLVTPRTTVGDWEDPAALANFLNVRPDGVLFEFENVPAGLIRELGEKGLPTHSGAELLGTAQSRNAEKNVARKLGILTTAYCYFEAKSGLNPIEGISFENGLFPGIVKTNREGYDGKGQFPVDQPEDLAGVPFKAGKGYVLERKVDLDYECSVMVARNAVGDMQISPAVRNVHQNGILHHSYWFESAVPREIENQAQAYAELLAQHFELVGLLCVEFFIDTNGELLFNEMAPRPHNSFHGTIEGCHTSQFDQYVQAVTGLPLMPIAFDRPWAMQNLLGKDILLIPNLTTKGWNCHDYGKAEIKDGRKMGHATMVVKSRSGLLDLIPDHRI